VSHPASSGIGREQILAQIAVLSEVRSSNPRDRRFQQWRQITTTLLQRMWPDQPARAQEFCRIQFSVTTILPNSRLTQEQFEKGCNAADAFLTALVKEMEGQPAAPPAEAQAASKAPPPSPVTLVKPTPETPAAPEPTSEPPSPPVKLVTPTAEQSEAAAPVAEIAPMVLPPFAAAGSRSSGVPPGSAQSIRRACSETAGRGAAGDGSGQAGAGRRRR
jgi:hypothetical protein